MGKTAKPKLLNRNHSDHFQTPPDAIEVLLPHLSPKWTIWEPACGKGNLVRAFSENGYKVIGSDINGVDKHDFLSDRPPKFHVIVTNPPFTLKDQFLARCYELQRPFALLLPLTVFDSIERRNLLRDNGAVMIVPNGRYSFETPSGKGSSSWFMTAWITWNLVSEETKCPVRMLLPK